MSRNTGHPDAGQFPRYDGQGLGADTSGLLWADYLRLWAGAIDKIAGQRRGSDRPPDCSSGHIFLELQKLKAWLESQ